MVGLTYFSLLQRTRAVPAGNVSPMLMVPHTDSITKYLVNVHFLAASSGVRSGQASMHEPSRSSRCSVTVFVLELMAFQKVCLTER